MTLNSRSTVTREKIGGLTQMVNLAKKVEDSILNTSSHSTFQTIERHV